MTSFVPYSKDEAHIQSDYTIPAFSRDLYSCNGLHRSIETSNNPSSESSAAQPSILRIYMDEHGDWFALGLRYSALAFIYGSLVLMALSEVVSCLQRWRRRRDAELAADRLLEGVPDVSYHQLPPDAAAAAEPLLPPSSSCVICMEDYREGERCLALPGCAHTFHRGCIAPWLRLPNTSCPICRRTPTAAAAAITPPAQQRFVIGSAEDMV